MLARASRSYAGGHAHGEHETHLVLAYINDVKSRIESELVSFCILKYSGDLNSKLFQYLNGTKQFAS